MIYVQGLKSWIIGVEELFPDNRFSILFLQR